MFLFESTRLQFRRFTATDLPQLHSILSDPITMQFWPASFTFVQSQHWYDRNQKRYKDLNFGRWAVILKETGELIGDAGIAFSPIDGQEVYDLGYIIHHPYWGKGYGFEAAKACKDYAFEVLKLETIYANMAFDHKGSQAVAEKIGMQKIKEFHNNLNRNFLTFVYILEKQWF